MEKINVENANLSQICTNWYGCFVRGFFYSEIDSRNIYPKRLVARLTFNF